MDILDKSSHWLGEIKTHITDLVKFFNDILKDVEHTVNTDIENLLGPIMGKGYARWTTGA